MLKTSHISASATAPQRAISSKIGGTGSGASIAEADVAVEAQEVVEAAAGDVRQAVDAVDGAGRQQLEDRADVDDGRLEQRVGDRGARQLRRRVVEREAALVEQGVARERVAVGVQAAGRQADDRVARAPPRTP